jgi:hypothetical protein
MTYRTHQPEIDRLNALIERDIKKGPVLLPRFWWLTFAFAVPFVFGACFAALYALHEHLRDTTWVAVESGSFAGVAGVLFATYFYRSLLSRLRH